MIVVIDELKVVKGLGVDSPVPVEVVKFSWKATKKALEKLGCTTELREVMEGEPFISDNSGYIIDCDFGKLNDPEALEIEINKIPGVIENGLFIDLADEVIAGSKQGLLTLGK